MKARVSERVRIGWGAARRVARRLAATTAQGTVEYVALILLVAVVLAGVVAAAQGMKVGKDIPELIVKEIKDAVNSVSGDGKKK